MSGHESSSRFTFKDYCGNSTEDGLPDRLQKYDQWLVTHDTQRNDKLHKSPKYPAKGWNDVDLLSFEQAQCRSREESNTALAFRFTENGPFIGFDLDNVKVEGDFTDEALSIVRQLNSYTEVSSSGTGLHIIAEGEHLDDYKSRGDLSESGHLEVYEHNRYFVLTGQVHKGHALVKNRPTAVREVQGDHLPKRQTYSFTDQETPGNERIFSGGETDVTTKQVRQTIREYAKGADVDKEVLRLWKGSNEGRDSTSEADMAFVKQLYFWCGADQQLMNACFCASGRMRSKWNEVHYSNGDTYGERTLDNVCQSNSKTFDGRYV